MPHCVEINTVPIVSKRAVAQYAVFKILYHQRIKDLLRGKPADDFTLLTIYDMLKRMDDRVPAQACHETYVRRPLNRTKADAQQILNHILPREVTEDDIIQTVGRKNGGARNYGYRLSPLLLIASP